MIAEGVRDTDLAPYQRAVRTLLLHPLVTTAHPDADALRLVRRHAPTLTRDLEAVAGYRLEQSATCARLVRRIDRLDPTQATVQPRNRKRFDRRRYAYLALVLGALGRAGTQVALSEVADGLRRRAADVEGLSFDPDEYRHRLAFVDVVVHLEGLGVLRPVEVSTVTYLNDPDAGEALYDIDVDAAHQLFVPPRVLGHVGSAADLLAGELTASRDTRRAASRQRLARLLLEHPVVYLDDLDDADRSYLLSQGRSLADDLARLTGASLERRAEGMALIDGTGGFSDRRFPAGGTPQQVALLLAAAIATVAPTTEPASVPTAAAAVVDLAVRLDRVRPTPPLAGEQPREDGLDLPVAGEPPAVSGRGPLLTEAWLVAVVEDLVARYGPTFAADLRADPTALLGAAVDVLVDFDLARRVPGGIVARPAIARFGAVEVTTAPSAQLSLLSEVVR